MRNLQLKPEVVISVIEEGGIPEIIWSDYNCDAFTTETQEGELLFSTIRES